MLARIWAFLDWCFFGPASTRQTTLALVLRILRYPYAVIRDLTRGDINLRAMGLVYTSLLFMVVPLVSSLESLDNALIEAGYNLGGNGWSVLRKIVIPHAAPGVTAGCIVVFMLTLGNYLTPTLLGGKNSQWFTEQIYTQFITRFNWEQGAAFGFLLLGLSTALVVAGLKISRQQFGDVMRRT